MKISMYILGSIEALCGILLLALTSLISEILPKLGRVAFQAAMAGSYSPSDYAISTALPNFLAILLILAGAAQIALALLKKK